MSEKISLDSSESIKYFKHYEFQIREEASRQA